MANIYSIPANAPNKSYPLRGDMAGCAIGFTPASAFKVGFFTEDAKQYTITALNNFKINGQTSSNKSFTFGGQAGLFVEFIYQPDDGLWECDKNNLVAGTSASGGGSGTTLQGGNTTVLAYNANPTVNIRTVGSVSYLDLGIPAGQPGTNGTGGTGGASLPVPSAIGYVLTATGTSANQWAWAPPAAGSGSGGSGGLSTAEVVLTADANGNYTPNAALGAAFRIVLTANGKLMNPVGYAPGQEVRVIIVQGGVGGFTLGYDLNYAFTDAQPPVLGTLPNAINKLTLVLTDVDTWISDMAPSGTYTAGYGKIRPIARINGDSTQYYVLANAAGTGAFNHLHAGGSLSQNTIVILRSGKSAEATGTIADTTGGTYLVAGAPIGGTGDQRPLLRLLTTDYSEGPPRGANRPSFGKQLLGAEGGGTTVGIGMTVEFRDLRLTGARNDDGDARGIGQNGQSVVTVNNCEITDCNNGILTDNATKTKLTINNTLIDRCGVGTPNTNANQGYNSSGYVHAIYAGHNEQTVEINNSTFSNTLTGHDLKARCATLILNGVLCDGSAEGRELDFPNGGILHATDCTFHKPFASSQNLLIAIGNNFENAPGSQEGIDTSRSREYIFRNCRFVNDINDGRDALFLASKDLTVRVQFIDCVFEGWALVQQTSGSDPFYAGMNTVNGIRFMPGVDPIFTNTSGVQGPRITPGRPANVAMTAVPA